MQSLDVIGDAIVKANSTIRENNLNLLKQGENFFRESIAKNYENALGDYQHILNKLKEISFPAEIREEHFKLINAYGTWVQSIAKTTNSICEKSLEQFLTALEQQASGEQQTLKAATELRKRMSEIFASMVKDKKND
jgi:hypothetical protein